MKVVHAVGARPNFMKIAPIMREMARYPIEFEQILVHTGQHYDDDMSKVFFEELELPQPDIYLGVGSGSHAQQTARIMMGVEKVLLERRPGWVIVVGDVNSTLACALTAAKLGVKVAHVEAGLRSFDRTMPEEYNRLLTDQIADLLFTPSRDADENLLREGVSPERIQFVGNVMIDTLAHLLPRVEGRPILADLGLMTGPVLENPPKNLPGVAPYVLVTLHRPSNVDDPATLKEIVMALDEISDDVPVIFPVHPRTRQRLAEFNLGNRQRSIGNLRFIEPLGYLDFLALERYAALVLTDSGGIQEETTYLGVPCLTARANTERPVTITQGTNRLVRTERGGLVEAVHLMLKNGCRVPSADRQPQLWDGCAAERIVQVLKKAV
ncbi:MAG: non-hydrolyzing UDP-N-acetylglucosamine 2-epimerase [Candidatus Binatia bacterium]